MEDEARGPGWDAQAIHEIAREHYNGLAELFEVNGWPERGNLMMPAVQGRVVQAYGTIANFKRAHDQSALLCPQDAITQETPNVWLKGYHFFDPQHEGFLGFTDEKHRRKFLEDTRPGALVVIYGTTTAPSADDRAKVLGILQLSHMTGHAERFMSEKRRREKGQRKHEAGRWNHAIIAVRAWKIPRDARVLVRDFADTTYLRFRDRNISRRGDLLVPHEALKILKFNLYEADVYGRPKVGFSALGSAEIAFTPSRAGPVSQSPYMVPEAEGPKHLYILKLEGKTHEFLGECAHGRIIVKVGFSASPERRRCDFNRTLPKGAFRWISHKSTSAAGRNPFPSSGHALAGEQAMKESLNRSGKSLGGEFFLAGSDEIEAAWRRGVTVAENWRGE